LKKKNVLTRVDFQHKVVWKNKINRNNTIVVSNDNRGSKCYILNKNGLYEEKKNERAENEE